MHLGEGGGLNGSKWARLCEGLEWADDSDRLGRWMCVFVSGGWVWV